MAEINDNDLISQKAIESPLLAKKNVDSLAASIEKLLTVSMKSEGNILVAKNVGKVTDETKKLTAAQVELEKIQKSIATAQAKNNDEYAKEVRVLDEVRRQIKDKTTMSEKDALATNRQTASLKQLEAALAKNRNAYANLKSEQDRTSASGLKLNKTIQDQDKEVKKLRASMGQHQGEVGHYQIAMEGLDGATGGVIGRFQSLGKQLLALASNPIVLIIGALVGAFVALNNSVNAYYATTAKGEEDMHQRQATWDAFFLTLKQGWADVGKAVSDFFGDNGLTGLLTAFLMQLSPTLAARFTMLETMANNLAKTMAQLARDHIRDVIDDANTEVKANAQLEISRNKVNKTAQERIAALREHNRLRKEQLQGDITLAEDDIKAEVQRLQMLGRRVDGQKLLSEMTDAELEATGLMRGEVESLGKLQAALLKVQSDASAGRISLLKLEKALIEEIHKEEIQRLQDTADKSVEDAKAAVEARIQLVREEVLAFKKTKQEGDAEILAIQKANAAQLIEVQIAALQKMMDATETTAEEDAEIAKKIVQLKIDLNKAVYDGIVTLGEATVEVEKSVLEKVFDIYQKWGIAILNIFDAVNSRRIAGIDAQMEKEEEYTANQIKLAGDNEDAIKRIEEQSETRRKALEDKKKQEQRKAAIAQKAAGLFEVGILNAINIMNAARSAPPPFNIPAIIAAVAFGALQLAAVAIKPIPQFAEGGITDTPVIIAGEKGPELYRTPAGEIGLTPGRATAMRLPIGTEITPNDETMKMLAFSSLGREVAIERENQALYSKLDSLEHTIKKYDKMIVDAIQSSSGSMENHGSIWYKAMKKADGSKKLIRLKSLNG